MAKGYFLRDKESGLYMAGKMRALVPFDDAYARGCMYLNKTSIERRLKQMNDEFAGNGYYKDKPVYCSYYMNGDLYCSRQEYIDQISSRNPDHDVATLRPLTLEIVSVTISVDEPD